MSATETETIVLAEGKWLRLLRRGRWEFAQRTKGGTAALIVALTDADELILIEQTRPAIGGLTVELPAGLIGDTEGEEDEAPALAAARELEEETGFSPARLEQVANGPSTAGLSDEEMIVFLAQDLTRVGEGGGVEHEDIRVHLVPIAQVETWLQQRASAGSTIDIKVWAGLYFAHRAIAARAS